MKNLNNVIETVKAVRLGTNNAWIFNEDGTIKEEVVVCDVLPVLEELKEFEVDTTEEEINYFINNAEHSGNTYNSNANITNHINWHTIGNKWCIMIHLLGDIRGNYTKHFMVDFEDDPFIHYLWELESVNQAIKINDRYTAYCNCFNDTYEVDDNLTGETLPEYFCCVEKNDLLQEIEELED